MGNLTNPVSLRIKSNIYWNSVWVSYINNNYSYLLSTDYLLYSYLSWFISRKVFLNFGWLYFYSHFKIMRIFNKVCIIFFFKDYKFYRFIFEYLSLILKLVLSKSVKTKIILNFNTLKIQNNFYKNYFSSKFTSGLLLSRKNKSDFLYFTCWLYTFYLLQQKYLYGNIVKNKYFCASAYKTDSVKKNIFFYNVAKLSNFLNLFYYIILLFIVQFWNNNCWPLNLLICCYSYYLFLRKYKDFQKNKIFSKSYLYFFKFDVDTDVILWSEFIKRSVRKKIYVFKRIILKKSNSLNWIFQNKKFLILKHKKYTTVLKKFYFENKKYSGFKFLQTNIVYLFNIKNKKKKIFTLFSGARFNLINNSILLKQIVHFFDYILYDFTKFLSKIRNRYFNFWLFRQNNYLNKWSFFKLYIKYLYIKYFSIKNDKSFQENDKISKNLYIECIDLFSKYFALRRQKAVKTTHFAKLRKRLLYIMFYLNNIAYHSFFSIITLIQRNWLFFCINLLSVFVMHADTVDFSLQFKKFCKSDLILSKSLLQKKNLLFNIAFNIRTSFSSFIYYYYYRLYSYFYYVLLYQYKPWVFLNNLKLIRQILLLFKQSSRTDTLIKYSFVNVNKILEKKKSAHKTAFFVKNFQLFKQKKQKLFSHMYFNIKNLALYRKALFTLYVVNYKYYLIAWKFSATPRYIYNILYPVTTFKYIILKYKVLRCMRMQNKNFKFFFKKNLNFYFDKYVLANKIKFLHPFILNNNIYLFYKNILNNLVILSSLRVAKQALFLFKNVYYRLDLLFNNKYYLNKCILNNDTKYNYLLYRRALVKHLYYFNNLSNSLNFIYSINSNIFITNFLKKIKYVFYFVKNLYYSKSFIWSFLKIIFMNFFFIFNFFLINLLEVSKFRLFFIKNICLLVNISNRHLFFAKYNIQKKKKRLYFWQYGNCLFKKKIFLLKFLMSMHLTRTTKLLRPLLNSSIFYSCKLRYLSNLFLLKKKILNCKLNQDLLKKLQIKYKNNVFFWQFLNMYKNNFFKAWRFNYKINLVYACNLCFINKRFLNLNLYLSKYYFNFNFNFFFKKIRFFYQKTIMMLLTYYTTDTKMLMYFCCWKQAKTFHDIFWLRQQQPYNLLLIIKVILRSILWNVRILFDFINVLVNYKSFKFIFAYNSNSNNILFKLYILNLHNQDFIFFSIYRLYLLVKCREYYLFYCNKIFYDMFNFIFAKRIYMKKVYCVLSSVYVFLLKKIYYTLVYLFFFFLLLFKRIYYSTTLYNVLCYSLFGNMHSFFFKAKDKKKIDKDNPQYNIKLYFYNVYLKIILLKKNIFILNKFVNLKIYFFKSKLKKQVSNQVQSLAKMFFFNNYSKRALRNANVLCSVNNKFLKPNSFIFSNLNSQLHHNNVYYLKGLRYLIKV